MCGGSGKTFASAGALLGLSPRVRGKLNALPPAAVGAGSIPACAGEASTSGIKAATTAVYPRVCGGSARMSLVRAAPRGLSPRVRGKRGTG